MKPRLAIRHGIWRCNRPGERDPCGFGYTPKGAFEEWMDARVRQMLGWPKNPMAMQPSEAAALLPSQTIRQQEPTDA